MNAKHARNYDVWPQVVVEKQKSVITIRPVGKQSAFPAGPLEAQILPVQNRKYAQSGVPPTHACYSLQADADHCLRVLHRFSGEQEYYIRVFQDEKLICQASVYSVFPDLAGLIPLMGDLHIHTFRSDGAYDPAIMAAEARKRGMDYLAVTDHHHIIGSIECVEAYADAPIDMNLMRGEEVHMPDADLHVVSIGGRYSVNAMAAKNVAYLLKKYDPEFAERHASVWREGEGTEFPGTMTDDEFKKMIWEYAETLDIPEDIPKYTYACFKWVCNAIRKAGGIAIFAHPYWIEDLYHADEGLTEYILRQKDYDAYEVLGGERYFEQNGFQTVQYYSLRASCGGIPIVGSSDTHNPYDRGRAFLASTIAFARDNTLRDIHDAMRKCRTVAVDWISPQEPRLVGDYRLVKYAQFLMNHYFPKHREMCFQEGTAMLEYAGGEREDGLRMLRAAKGRIPKLWGKYFPGITVRDQ